MSTTSITTFELFKDTVLGDDDRGYPDRVAFVPEDIDNVDAILWRNLHEERRPTVVVMADGVELLLTPCQRDGPLAWIDSLRKRERVVVSWRYHHLASPYAVTTRVGRKPLAGMRLPLVV